MKTILSLCDYTGEWSRPYAESGYQVIRIDTKLGGPWGGNVLELETRVNELPKIHGVLAAPPCTDFSYAGARWFPRKDADGSTELSIQIVRACLSIVAQLKPAWWVLENPRGRIARLVPELGEPTWKFNPCDFGDPYTKLTHLWGKFTPLFPLFVGRIMDVEPVDFGVRLHGRSAGKKLTFTDKVGFRGKSVTPEERQALRSVTPAGFARAFFCANP